MSILDTTIVNVALETLGRELDASMSTIQWVLDRLPARARDGHPADRLGDGALRGQADVDDVGRPVPRRLGALRARVVDRVADRLPRPAGLRRRHDHADRPGDPRPGGRAAADGAGHEHDRRADAARADPRARDRRPDRRQLLLALDLLRQRAGGRRWRSCWRGGSCRGRSRRGGRRSTCAGCRCCRRGWRCSSSGSRSSGSQGGLDRPRVVVGLVGGAVLLVGCSCCTRCGAGAKALIDLALFRDRLRGRLGDDASSSACRFRRDAAPAALLPDRARRGRARRRPAAGAAGRRRGARDADRGAADRPPRRGADRPVRGGGRAASAPASTRSSTADTSYALLGVALFVRGLGLGVTMMPAMAAAYQTLAARPSRARRRAQHHPHVGGSFGTAVLAVVLERRIVAERRRARRATSARWASGGVRRGSRSRWPTRSGRPSGWRSG